MKGFLQMLRYKVVILLNLIQMVNCYKITYPFDCESNQ
jgi:hypothetical protein